MTEAPERMLPLYEAKMLAAYDHRDADVVKSATAATRQNQPRYLSAVEHQDPYRSPTPLVWVAEDSIPELSEDWFCGLSDVTSATNERTVKAAALPSSGVGNTYPLVRASVRIPLLACLNSLALDYVARQKVPALHLNFRYLYQFPVPRPATMNQPAAWSGAASTSAWIAPLVLELTYTAWDMQPFAEDLGDTGAPFVWDPERRFLLRAELDGAFFHLYGVPRDDVGYILNTFPIVRRKDEEAHGEFRTKRAILEIFDAMQDAIDTGIAYASVLDPVPGFGHRHPPRSR